jgi:hypothetical protein
MSFPPYIPFSPGIAFLTRNRLLVKLMTTTLALGGAGWLGVALWGGSAKRVLIPDRDELIPPTEIAWAASGFGAQVVVEGDMPEKINFEAYNRKRAKDIADDSNKLLSLAIELKTEVNSQPGSTLSPDEVKKLKEIEKLARRVKSSMTINLGGPI